IMSDHGMGWPGGWSDPDPAGAPTRSLPLSSALGDQLYLMEMDEALQKIRAQTGIDQLELIGLDACLMGHIEVMSALAPHARYAVLSQETEPALGWAYTSFLQALTESPDMDGAQLGRHIVESYITEDQRIVDDQARLELVGRGLSLGGMLWGGAPSAEQISGQFEGASTLTAVDLSALPQVMASVNDLAYALTQVDQRAVAQARTYAQSFTSIFGSSVPPSYLDLGNFVQLAARATGNAEINQKAQQVLAAVNQAVVAEKHGAQKPGASGISIYFPNSELYRSPVAGPQSYTVAAGRFAQESLWDDFLAYHYTKRPFQPATTNVVVPGRADTVIPVGSGGIQVSPVRLSGNVAAPGRPVLLSADVRGENVGYVYLFVGYLDRQSNSLFIADMDYLESNRTYKIDGVYYPDWGDGAFTLEFEWEPFVLAIDDGVHSEVALFTPQAYGASPEEAVYTVDGTYTYADSGDRRKARLHFVNGVLQRVYGFTGEAGVGAPREILPQVGDTFTITETWMELDQSGQATQTVTQDGGTLTFGNQAFTWKELDAAPGEYIVGFMVRDLDGQGQEAYAPVQVR
ncbi:MAG: hypothetical protein GX605_12915, partial [Chloroflexi bacterium]|nr:hypothetical protein [Chloroflexota bacterium]